ncbi:Telomerase ribonucleoprotein complex RNA binding domain-containing protein [Copromyces sp. CBS 386.78]|nr:Telomerase ribonucleoprotein complex RNA binding domain-containing protein [Copromyces sp. CBS 386.78]
MSTTTKRKSVSFLELDSTGNKIPEIDHYERTGPPPKRPKRQEPVTINAPQHPQRPPESSSNPNPITQTLLSIYYPQTLTLRQYALSKLPKSSKIRRRKISQVGLFSSSSSSSPTLGAASEKSSAAARELEQALGYLLDTTLVCSRHDQSQEKEKKEKTDYRWEQWVSFSQGAGSKGDESHVTLSDGLRGALYSQADIVDFVIWLLFSRSRTWPKHLLCDGFRKGVAPPPQAAPREPVHQIPGVYSVHTNTCVRTLKEAPWPQFLLLLGQEGESIMLDLLLDCAVFVAVKQGKGNLLQVSGVPVSELQPLGTMDSGKKESDIKLTPSEITFARNRMLYARAALNARGSVHFGLRHIHVLNRFPCKAPSESEGANKSKPDESTTHVMMYMFPRQFRLHNVFTSVVDRQQTVQKFQDYTLREEEIANKFPKPADGEKPKVKIPKRLRGKTQELVHKLQVLHRRCSYADMLQYYCPLPKQLLVTQSSQLRISARSSKSSQKTLGPPSTAQVINKTDNSHSLLDLATPISSISAFCQAVLSKIIPNDFWGPSPSSSSPGLNPSSELPTIQSHNKHHFLKQIDAFIRLRRFESMTLHQVVQGLQISSIPWLAPPSFSSFSHKCSQGETNKRKEILHEFLYYIFDSLLIPLLRSNFYVTESSSHRYRLFFFRHDVWLSVTKPAMTTLKLKMFEEVKGAEAVKILEGRKLGFSQVRLLPKGGTGGGLRPIMNLRRRGVLLQGRRSGNSKVIRGGKKQMQMQMLGPSINSVLGPVASMLNFEKRERPEKLGGGMFAVGDIYERIKRFRARFFAKAKKDDGKEKGLGNGKKKTRRDKKKNKFYFVKVDVQAAFDTIPQQAMVDLLEKIPGYAVYKESKHVEVSLPLDYEHNNNINDNDTNRTKSKKPKPTKRWHSTTTPFPRTKPGPPPPGPIPSTMMTQNKNKKQTIFIPSHSSTKLHTSSSLLSLAKEHITQNLVRIGKKYYRQKTGIPQGSVLSSTLCNYFYADLERSQGLAFLGLGVGLGLGGEDAEDRGDNEEGEEGGQEDQEDQDREYQDPGQSGKGRGKGRGERSGKGKGKGRGVSSKDGDTLLMRLIDDFLLITTNQKKATRFVEVMHRGFPEYGVRVSPNKSLVNFDVAVAAVDGSGRVVPKLKGSSSTKFPYCGLMIDTQTLEIVKPRPDNDNDNDDNDDDHNNNQKKKKKDRVVVFNGITVEYSKNQGRNFRRKVLNAFKIQSHLLFFDTTHNSFFTTLRNLHSAFVETAVKMWAHARCLSTSTTQKRKPSTSLVIDTIKSLIRVSHRLLTSKSRKERYPGYQCTVAQGQVAWLAMVACRQVFVRKQAGYKGVIEWLEGEIQQLTRGDKKLDTRVLVKVVREVG